MRSSAFLMIFFLFWITTTPFVDLRNPDILLAAEDGSLLEQSCVLLAFAASVCVLIQRKAAARLALSPAFLLILLWGVVSVITSTHVDLSIRRFVLTMLVMAIAVATILLPRDEKHFAQMLAFGCGVVLAIAYFGVAFLPEVSIHNLAEVAELDNAGSWRGLFAHKNIAGAAMVVVMAYGLFVAARLHLLTGWSITVLAAFFLLQTNNKTSVGLVAASYLLAAAAGRARPLWLKALFTIGPVIAMLLFTVGSVIFDPIGKLVVAVSSDPTFTNRTMIWRFAVDNLSSRSLFGFGFEAFWSTSSLINGGSTMETQAATAGHAHDSYLNVALTMGIPGVVLLANWLLWEPVRDFHRSADSGNDPAIAIMYLRIWLFCMLYACLESPFFANHGPIWFSLLGAVLGLRLHARAHQTASSPMDKMQWDAPVRGLSVHQRPAALT